MGNYEKASGEPAFWLYIGGVGVGMNWVNAVAKETGGKRLFCPPDKLALRADNYRQILESAIERTAKWEKPYPPELPVEAVLLGALEETFPCK